MNAFSLQDRAQHLPRDGGPPSLSHLRDSKGNISHEPLMRIELALRAETEARVRGLSKHLRKAFTTHRNVGVCQQNEAKDSRTTPHPADSGDVSFHTGNMPHCVKMRLAYQTVRNMCHGTEDPQACDLRGKTSREPLMRVEFALQAATAARTRGL